MMANPRPRRELLKEGREHLTVTNEFQSDKYPWCPAGFVPIKVTDPMASDLLCQYAERRKAVDAEFCRDLMEALSIPDEPDDPKRERFEAFASREGFQLCRYKRPGRPMHGNYMFEVTESAWRAWQMAWQSACGDEKREIYAGC